MSGSRKNKGSASVHVRPPPPPPPPPLPPPTPTVPLHRAATAASTNRATSALARLAQPFTFMAPSRSAINTGHAQFHQSAESVSSSRDAGRTNDTLMSGESNEGVETSFQSPTLLRSSQIATHKTAFPIEALDISPDRTTAVIAGRNILKTLRVCPNHCPSCPEQFNIRAAVVKYHSSSNSSSGYLSSTRFKDSLAAYDVKWSRGDYSHVIATAGPNGRIVIYDLNRAGVELGRLQEHSRQVHKLAFNPHRGAWLLSGSQDASIRMWDLRILAAERAASRFGGRKTFNGYNDAVRDVRWSLRDGVQFAAATDSGMIQHWDMRNTAVPLAKFQAHDGACFSIDFHPNKTHMLSAGADKRVKIWDMTSTERRPKPCFSLKTPQTTVNARWREPASPNSEGSTDWQKTHIVTSYDAEDSRTHLWDLRRPYIPFKEFDRYECPPTDLLWHSSNYVWMVGSDGMFTQVDFANVPQVIDRRSTSALTWSPNGDFLAFSEKRVKRRGLAGSSGVTEFIPPSSKGRASGTDKKTNDTFGYDEADSSVDNGLYRGWRGTRKASTAKMNKAALDVHSTSKDSDSGSLADQNSSKPRIAEIKQAGFLCRVPGATFDPVVFEYLAENYTKLLQYPNHQGQHKETPAQALENVICQLEHNAAAVARASPSQYRLAQTWKILSYLVQHEKAALEQQDVQPLSESTSEATSRNRGSHSIREEMLTPGPKTTSSKSTLETSPGQADSPPLSSFEHALRLSSPMTKSRRDPPSVSRAKPPRKLSSVIEDDQDMPPKQRSSSALSQNLSLSHEPLTPDFKLQASRPPNFRNYSSERLHKGGIPIRGQVPPDDLPLSGSPSRPIEGRSYSRRGNWRLGSNPATDRAVEMGRSLSSSLLADREGEMLGFQTNDIEAGSPPSPARPKASTKALAESMDDSTSTQDNSAHLDRPSSPLPFLADSHHNIKDKANQYHLKTGDSHNCKPLLARETQNKSWSIGHILRQAIAYYSNVSPVDHQSAVQFIRIMHLLFGSYEGYLSKLECEFILRSYNDMLMKQQLFISAAELRLFCVSAYPSVYDYAQKDTYINVYCFQCKKPYENPVRNNRRCHRCQVSQAVCQICQSLEPLAEWVAEYNAREVNSDEPTFSQASTDESHSHKAPRDHSVYSTPPYRSSRPHGLSLWSWCQVCGHGAHTVCQVVWFNETELSGGGCATPGCSHDCVSGQRQPSAMTSTASEDTRQPRAPTNHRDTRFRTGLARCETWPTIGGNQSDNHGSGIIGGAGAVGKTGRGDMPSSLSKTSAGGGSQAATLKKVRVVTPASR